MKSTQLFFLLFLLMFGWNCKSTKVVDTKPTPPSSATTQENTTAPGESGISLEQAPNESIIFLQLNDVYEIAALESGKVGGMARVATVRQELLQESPHTFTILAGDFLSPSVIGTVKLDGQRIKGAQMVDVMNQVGVDYVVFGNHEFDLKEEELQARLDESKFEWIATNVWHESKAGKARFHKNSNGEKTPVPTTTVINLLTGQNQFIRMGVIGVTLDVNQPDYVSYDDVFTSARKAVDSLKTATDFVIAITHLSIDQDRELARQIPELALIMGGHEHERHYEVLNGVPIAKADANAKSVYIHRINYDPATNHVNVSSKLKLIDDRTSSDPYVAASVADWEKRAYDAFLKQGFNLNEVVAKTEVPLDGLESHIRTRQTNLGTAIAQAMYEAAEGVDAVFFNSGSIRLDDYLTGKITQFDIIRTLPFGGKVVQVELTGALLKKVLDTGLKNYGSGGYFQLYKIEKKDDQWIVADQPIQPDKTYKIATTDFMLTGFEMNMEFFTRDTPGISKVIDPKDGSVLADMRQALIVFLKAN